jgi:hypothetical protein
MEIYGDLWRCKEICFSGIRKNPGKLKLGNKIWAILKNFMAKFHFDWTAPQPSTNEIRTYDDLGVSDAVARVRLRNKIF